MPWKLAPVALFGAILVLPCPAVGSGGSMPAGLPQVFTLGVANGNPGTLGWVQQTKLQNGACWGMHYQYLTGGVNTNEGWETWIPDRPRGEFATSFMNGAHTNGLIPVFTYYEIVPSTPDRYDESQTLAKLNNAALMDAYYDNFKLLLDKLHDDGRTAILHVEPDLWGMIHQSVFQTTNDPASVPVRVGSSGNPLVSGFANNAKGFAQALVDLRDRYAANAILAIHWSAWGNNDLIHCADCSQATIDSELAKNVEFYGRLSSPRRWDLFFADPDDRDADWHYLNSGGRMSWLSPTATNIGGSPPSFARLRYLLDALSNGLQMRSMLWQLPVGNSYYRTLNNSEGHYRDNIVEHFLPPVASYGGPQDAGSHVAQFAAAGVLGLLFGAGASSPTQFIDAQGDLVTNPSTNRAGAPGFSVWGQAVSQHADDDGGYLRLGGAAYCAAGAYPLDAPPAGPLGIGSPLAVPCILAALLYLLRRRRR